MLKNKKKNICIIYRFFEIVHIRVIFCATAELVSRYPTEYYPTIVTFIFHTSQAIIAEAEFSAAAFCGTKAGRARRVMEKYTAGTLDRVTSLVGL